MKKKLTIGVIIFVSFILMIIKPSFGYQTMGSITREAMNNLDGFLNMNIELYTDGNTDPGAQSYAYYCMDPFTHGWANHNNMLTSVVDVGKNGISSVNNLSTTNSEGARRAMQVLYYATKSYQNREPWGATGTSPYRLMMMQTSAMYSSVMVSEGLFNSSLPGGVSESFMINQFGRDKYYRLKAEGENFVNSTKNFNFVDKSTQNIQVLEEVGEWVFVGPYKIQNTGSGTITKGLVTTEDGRVCKADGWASTPNPAGVQGIASIPNGGTFYLAFKNEKPDSAKKVQLYKKVSGGLRARMVFYASNGGQNMATYGGKFLGNDEGSEEIMIELPRVYFTNIYIQKKDEDTGKALANVGFMVHCKERGWLVDGTPATYTQDKTKATIYKTGVDGKVKIRNINKKGTYTVYEVTNPHFGYVEVSIDQPKEMGTIDIKAVGQSINKTYTNKRIYVKLSGYVWEDMISQKTSIRNHLWKNDQNDQEDKRVANIKVTLKKADGTIIDTKTTNTITNTKGEKEEGAYIFGDYQRDNSTKRILVEDLRGAYIEFDYNGMCYKSVDVKTTANNGSKATDDKLRPEFNNNYAIINHNQSKNSDNKDVYKLNYSYNNHVSTLQYGGNYLYGYDGQKYPVSGIDKQYMLIANTKDAAPDKLLGQTITIEQIYANSIEEIPYINLGLYEREMPDIALIEDVEKAKITLNGYTHTYKYNQRFENSQETGDGFNVSVKFGNKWGSASYTREIYSSDVSYNAQDENKGKLQVYVTYKIAIKNEATNLYTKINNIVNYFDNRYEISSIKDQSGNDIQHDVDANYNNNGFKKVTINTNKQINPQMQEFVYIEYKLNNEAVNAVLNEDVTLNSVTEISSYSSYTDKEFSEKYAGIDKDSNPESTAPADKVTYEDDTDSAPSLILKAPNARVIKGTIWKDEAIKELLDKTGIEKERKGNGKYETKKEGVVGNVKVELLKVEGNQNGNEIYSVATLYNKDKTTKPAEMNTGTDGNYEFSGVIPGNYVIRYTYGNTSKIYKIDGSTEDVKIINYKSTIYRGGNKDEVNQMTDYWYRNETGKDATRLSDAKDEMGVNKDGTKFDIVEARTKEEIINYSTSVEKNLESIESNTRKFDIKLDYDVNLDNISEYGADLKFIFDNMDFGIIERPMQLLNITKEISHVKLTLANGQIIVDGDPRTGNIQHLKFLPDGNIHVEIDSELIQGATLEVEYEIKVDNRKAEIDFNEKDYYIYGIANNKNNWKLATVTELYDYLSNDLTFKDENLMENNGDWIIVKPEELKPGVNLSQEAWNYIKKYNRIFKTEKFANMKPGTVETARMTVSKLLSNTQDDYSFDNHIEVNELKDKTIYDSISGNYVPGNSTTYESDNDEKIIVITGPTGENKNYLPYVILGISGLITLAAGIILIKKKM